MRHMQVVNEGGIQFNNIEDFVQHLYIGTESPCDAHYDSGHTFHCYKPNCLDMCMYILASETSLYEHNNIYYFTHLSPEAR